MIAYLNGAFVGQRITGQQRFATEMTSELLARHPGEYQLVTPIRSGVGRGYDWAWTQSALPARTRGTTLASFTSRVPVLHPRHVATVHDLFPLTHPEWYSSRYLALHRPLLRRTLKHARAIMAVSQPVAVQIRALGLAGDDVPVVVAPNAPSPGPAATGEVGAAVRRVLDGPPFLLSVASTDPRKNVSRMTRAYRSLDPDLRASRPMVLVGGASGGVFASAQSDTDDADVVRLGYVTDVELAALYRAALCFVSTSLDEGFGLPLVEAAAVGCPLLVSDIPTYRWVLGDAATFFDPHDIDTISAGMVKLVEGPRETPPSLPRKYSWRDSARIAHELLMSL